MPDVIMPRLSDSMEEGTIIRWLKADGDEVARGEELVEIETDKATMAYESDFAGTLAIILPEGAAAPVGTLIGVVGDAQELARARDEAPPATVTASGNGGSAVIAPAAPAAAVADAPAKASPLARRIAQRLGVSLAAVSGSGPHGRILKADVIAAAASPAPAPAVALPAPGVPDGDGLQELTRTQAVIARRMSESRTTVPEFALQVDVDMSGVLVMRSELKALADPAPSVNDIIVKACAMALRRHPRANGSFAADGFALHARVNVAIAVATEGALIAPVVFDADTKTVGAIAHDTRGLIERVRDGNVAPADLDGGTFTVSNLGMFGIDRFEGIINAPQAAILCVGAITDRPVAVDGQVVIRPIVAMTLACDHRILYGADAARFLGDIRRTLEQPLALVL